MNFFFNKLKYYNNICQLLNYIYYLSLAFEICFQSARFSPLKIFFFFDVLHFLNCFLFNALFLCSAQTLALVYATEKCLPLII